MTLARDASNYSVDPLPLEAWRAAGVGLVILQAFPPSYKQYLQQVRQMRQCAAARMPFDLYVYDYLADPSWRDSAIVGMLSLIGAGLVIRRLWADEEDVSPGAQTLGVVSRQQAIRATLAALDRVPTKIGLTGVYTGAWWWTSKRYVANTAAFSDRPLWDAHYDAIANTETDFVPYGGWSVPSVRIKQYAGSQPDGTDLDVLSASEVGLLPKPEETSMAIVVGPGMQAQMSAASDAPLFGHKFFSEVDDQGASYDVEQCYGSRGLYASSNASGQWVNAGPLA